MQFDVFCLFAFIFTATDVAGEVVKVGPAGKKFKPGDKVVAVLDPLVMLTLLHALPFHLLTGVRCRYDAGSKTGIRIDLFIV